MTYDETEIVADAALQLGTLRDCLAKPADLGDGQFRLIEQGITKVIGLLGALPIESEGPASDVIYVVVSTKTGVPLTCYASREDADADVNAVNDHRAVSAWVLR